MKGVTFAAAFFLTVFIVIAGTLVYPNLFGPAVTSNAEYVFGFFLGTFMMLLLLGWMSEKVAGFARKPRKKNKGHNLSLYENYPWAPILSHTNW